MLFARWRDWTTHDVVRGAYAATIVSPHYARPLRVSTDRQDYLEQLCKEYKTTEGVPGGAFTYLTSGTVQDGGVDATVGNESVLVRGTDHYGYFKSVLLGAFGYFEELLSGKQSVHAALVERDGEGTLLVAPSGRGKSTYARALCVDGWRLVTDDWVVIDQRTPVGRRGDVWLRSENVFGLKHPSDTKYEIDVRDAGLPLATRASITRIVVLGENSDVAGALAAASYHVPWNYPAGVAMNRREGTFRSMVGAVPVTVFDPFTMSEQAAKDCLTRCL